MSDELNGKIRIVDRILKADPVRIVLYILLGCLVYAGKIVVDRAIRSFDKMEAVADRTVNAVTATAQAIEQMTRDNRSGRDNAVKIVSDKVDQCCPASRRR